MVGGVVPLIGWGVKKSYGLASIPALKFAFATVLGRSSNSMRPGTWGNFSLKTSRSCPSPPPISTKRTSSV